MIATQMCKFYWEVPLKCLGFWNSGQFSTQHGVPPQPPQAFLKISVRLHCSIQTPGKGMYSLEHTNGLVQANVGKYKLHQQGRKWGLREFWFLEVSRFHQNF